jgi:hypothetical protein
MFIYSRYRYAVAKLISSTDITLPRNINYFLMYFLVYIHITSKIQMKATNLYDDYFCNYVPIVGTVSSFFKNLGFSLSLRQSH